MAKKKAAAKKAVSSKKPVKNVSKKKSAKNQRFQPPPIRVCVAVEVPASVYDKLQLSPPGGYLFDDTDGYLPQITEQGNGQFKISAIDGKRFDDFGYLVSENGDYQASIPFTIYPDINSNCRTAVLTVTQKLSAKVLGNLVVTVLAKKKPKTNQA